MINNEDFSPEIAIRLNLSDEAAEMQFPVSSWAPTCEGKAPSGSIRRGREGINLELNFNLNFIWKSNHSHWKPSSGEKSFLRQMRCSSSSSCSRRLDRERSDEWLMWSSPVIAPPRLDGAWFQAKTLQSSSQSLSIRKNMHPTTGSFSLTKGCRIGLTANQPDSSKIGLQSSQIYGRSSLTLSGNPDFLQFYYL